MSERVVSERPTLPNGLVAVVKADCPTCTLVVPALEQLAQRTELTVYTQDDPQFPSGLDPLDDTDLAVSWHHEIETVPTLIRVHDGVEVERTVGWNRERWEQLAGVTDLAGDLVPYRPGCGSRSVDPDLVDRLRVRHGGSSVSSRRIEVGRAEDVIEAMYDRGWSDGLPLVPPTEERVARMLAGTSRSPDDLVAVVPPDLVECTVEKVAINAVMAGCLPEHLPLVLAAVEGACTEEFNIHGVLATTMPVGPVLIVNGPIRHRLGMNSGINVFGQGDRTGLTVGRALQLVIRNVGGGRPGEVDRATHGNPGKLSFCFAEDEEASPFPPFSTQLGAEPGTDTVTLFPGEGPRCVVDQLSRDPDSLARSLAAALAAVHHPKLALMFDAIVAIGPEHARVLSGWSRERLVERLQELVTRPGEELCRGAAGMAEGMPEYLADRPLPKFRDGGLLVVHCGGGAGLFSAVIGGWVNGQTGSTPVVRPIEGAPS